MKDRAMMLRKIAFARGAMELSPETATGMAVGTEVPQPKPAAIATARMGTEVLGGIDRAGASVRWRYRVGAHGRGDLRMRDILLTQGTVWFLGQAGKRFGVIGSFALGLDGRRCRWYRSLSARLGTMQHDEEPHEGQQSELVVKKV
jgi:hypothetical protein